MVGHFVKYDYLCSCRELDERLKPLECLYSKYEATARRQLSQLSTKTGNSGLILSKG